FILSRVGFVVYQILLILVLIFAVLVHFRHHRQLLGVLEIEQKLDRSFAAAHGHRVAANYRRQRCEALLSIAAQPSAVVGIALLSDREILQRNFLVGLPQQEIGRA